MLVSGIYASRAIVFLTVKTGIILAAIPWETVDDVSHTVRRLYDKGCLRTDSVGRKGRL